ncbi:protein of unknown function [Denitratisoma oestradiolicum]|uniref:Uncharacterized protein n=1 Tax=Denitratisoma oestradiolicum TaxID=311182 RepID=A0A6S6XZM8_9PROT|nr:protein of unknown function [Denitratisoma oestradiolicum]
MVWGTTKGATGAGCIIMSPCALPLTPSCFTSALSMAVKKTLLDHKRLPYPRITALAAAGRAQRHVPDSISTLRTLIAARIAQQLQRCPCCGSIKRNL